MKILNNYVKNECYNKESLSKAADWVLTPCRKAFKGKKFAVVKNDKGIPNIQESQTQAPSRLKRVLWGVLAVSTIPFAAIAALFKLVYCPEIGTTNKPILNNKFGMGIDNLIDAAKELKKAGFAGKVTFNFLLSEKLSSLSEDKANAELMKVVNSLNIYLQGANVGENPEDRTQKIVTLRSDLRWFNSEYSQKVKNMISDLPVQM